MNYRYFVIKEIISTEENYIRDLSVINDVCDNLLFLLVEDNFDWPIAELSYGHILEH